MNKYILSLAIILIVLFNSCKKTDPPIPLPIEIEDEWPIFVDTGANMVAYKVDGKIRVAKNISKIDSNSGFLSCGYLLHEEYKLFFLWGNRIADERFDGVQIVINDLKSIGTYKLSSVDIQLVGAYSLGTNEANSKQYTTNELDSGTVLITKIDTIKGVITGRFEFTGKYVFGFEKKVITDGQFDVKYYR